MWSGKLVRSGLEIFNLDSNIIFSLALGEDIQFTLMRYVSRNDVKPRGIPFINLIHKSAISIQIHFVLSVSLFPLICLLKKVSLCIIRDIFQFINYSELNENEQYHSQLHSYKSQSPINHQSIFSLWDTIIIS